MHRLTDRLDASLLLEMLFANNNAIHALETRLNHLDCSSEEEEASEGEESSSSSRDFLESFQRSKIKQKMQWRGKPRRGSRVQPEDEGRGKEQQESLREFILQNKAPFWNELSQVYQLDFGGRVTQESAKNFQIEHQANQVRDGMRESTSSFSSPHLPSSQAILAGNRLPKCASHSLTHSSSQQVMQFGRIDGNAYTLDFQYPFSALQALAVALANVTQRLK